MYASSYARKWWFSKKCELIDELLNNIKSYIIDFEFENYDTHELAQMYSIVKEKVLIRENIEELYKSNQLDEVIKTLQLCDCMLHDLYEQIKNANNDKEKANEKYNNDKSELEEVIKNKPRLKGTAFAQVSRAFSLLLIIAGLIGGPLSIKACYDDSLKGYEVTKYEYNTLGKSVVSTFHDDSNLAKYHYVILYDYSSSDEAGYRIRRTYKFENPLHLENGADSLAKIDLSRIHPVEEQLCYVENKTIGNYRTYEAATVDRSKRDYIENLSKAAKRKRLISSIGIGIVISLIPLILDFCTRITLDVSAFEYYTFLLDLIKYKSKLKIVKEQLAESESEKDEYYEVYDIVCNRIDRVVDEVCNRFSSGQKVRQIFEEYEKQLQIAEKIRAAEELQKAIAESEREKELIKKQIEEAAQELANALSLLNEEEYKKYLHSIEISEELLFEKVGENHYRIRKCFKKILPLFNLKGINFDNVEGHDVNFDGSNAKISPNMIYDKDLSHSEFDDDNILDWANYNGVDIRGTKLGENPSTMVDLKSAITDEETTIRGLKIKA